MTPTTVAAAPAALLAAVGNLAHYHREHEKYYSEAPLHEAAALQRASRTLKALAERWSAAAVSEHPLGSPFAGAPDLNDERAIETSGVLFMEGGGPPAEIARIRRDLDSAADAARETGTWLGAAMDAAWSAAEALLPFGELADLLGERHSIIANDWQNASLLMLIARQLSRAGAVLAQVDFSTAALRADLSGPRRAPAYLFSAAELIDQAADLHAHSAMLVHQNERRWRVFRDRVAQLTGPREATP